MPLSEHEQRILADIEAGLRAEDPGLAKTVGRRATPPAARGRTTWVIAGLVVGFVLLFVGLAVHLVWGVLGFALMLAAAYYGLTAAKAAAEKFQPGAQGAGGETRGPLARYLDNVRRTDDDS